MYSANPVKSTSKSHGDMAQWTKLDPSTHVTMWQHVFVIPMLRSLRQVHSIGLLFGQSSQLMSLSFNERY